MPGKWHNAVTHALSELCDNHPSYGKVYDGNKAPIGITIGKTTYHYQPDIYAVYERTERVDVYEAIDTESEGDVVMDLVYSALTPRIETIGMIFSEFSKLDAARDHARIILSRLCREAMTSEGKAFWYEPLISHYSQKYFIHVPKRITNPKKIARILKKKLEFDVNVSELNI